MATQLQQLQNIINNNNPQGLSGAIANEKLMNIINAIYSVIAAGGGGKGTSVIGWKSAVNALMADLGTSYQLTGADISAYKNFSD